MSVFVLMMLSHLVAAEPTSDTGSCEWEDVMELLHHINNTEDAEVRTAYPIETDMSLCYETVGTKTQLFMLTPWSWEPMGFPTQGTVVDALKAQPNELVQQVEPSFVLPCAIMGTPGPFFISTHHETPQR
jgi:hypothetical protein